MSKRTCRDEKKSHYDYILVGAGTSGAVLAKLLTDDFETSVLVIEAGGDQRENALVQTGVDDAEGYVTDTQVDLHIHTPVQFGSYPDNNLGDFHNYTEGRMWGGSSGHNYLVAVRGTPDIYEAWANESGQPAWRYDRLLPAMKYLETYRAVGQTVNTEERGTSGPLFITRDPLFVPDGTFMAAVASAANAPTVVDYNDPTEGLVGAGANQLFIDAANQRSYAASAFLGRDVVDAEGRGVGGRKLTIVSHAMVSKVLLTNREGGRPRATGVRYYKAPAGADNLETQSERLVDAHAKHVILCAGAVASPQILQRSGIGPKEVLEPLGIEVVVDNANVGRNVQNHYGYISQIPMDEDDPLPATGAQAYVDLSGYSIGPNDGVRRFQFIFSPQGYVFGFMLRPAHDGTIEIVSSDPTVPALIQLHALEDADDIATLIASLKALGNISIAYTGALPYFPDPELYPSAEYGLEGGDADGDEGLLDYLTNDDYGSFTPTNHISGSCRMAESADDGVVDGCLHVHGVDGLSVADNSVAPEIETGNTAYMAYVIGLIKAKLEGADVPF